MPGVVTARATRGTIATFPRPVVIISDFTIAASAILPDAASI